MFCNLIAISQNSQVASKNSNEIQTLTKGDFTLGNREFLLNGKSFLIRASELH
jgi:hypothetical protein